jgi:hypothetical protein
MSSVGADIVSDVSQREGSQNTYRKFSGDNAWSPIMVRSMCSGAAFKWQWYAGIRCFLWHPGHLAAGIHG